MVEYRLHIEILEEESGQIRDVDIESVAGVTSIGRDRSCQVVLNAPSVSRQHCRIAPEGEGWAVVDDGSTLGTLLNGQKLKTSVTHSLQDGDVIVCPGYELRIHLISVTDPTLQPDPNALGRLLREADGDSLTPARVWIFSGGDLTNHVLPDEGAALTIGRSGECNIQIADPFKVVSAVHAKVERNWAGVFLYDTSINGVFVNRQRAREETKLQDGDRITIAVAEEAIDRPLLVFTEEGNSETPGGHGTYVPARSPVSPDPKPATPGAVAPEPVIPESLDPGPADPASDVSKSSVPDRRSVDEAVAPPSRGNLDENSDFTDSMISALRTRGKKPNVLLILVLIICALALATVFVWGVLLLR